MMPDPPRPTTTSGVIRRVFVLQQDRRRWPDALGAGVSMALPVVIGWAAGDINSGLIATIGSLTALYGTDRPYLNRGIHLAAITVSFGVTVGLTTWAAQVPWAAVPTFAAMSMVVVLLCNALAVGPPGAYMLILGCSAGIAAAPEHPNPWQIGLLVVGGGAISWLVQMSGVLVAPRGPERAALSAALEAVTGYVDALGSVGEADARNRAARALYSSWVTFVTYQPVAPTPGGELYRLRVINFELHRFFAAAMSSALGDGPPLADAAASVLRLRELVAGRGLDGLPVDGAVVLMARPSSAELLRRAVRRGSPALAAAVRAGVAVLVVGLISLMFDIQHAYWAMAAAVLMLHQGIDWVRTLQKSIERQLGTFVGILLTVAVLALHPPGLAVAVVLGVAQFVTVIFTLRNYAIAVVFVTCAALIIATGGRAVDGIGEILWSRGIDTLIGCQVALVVYRLMAGGANRRLSDAIVRTLDAIRSVLKHIAQQSVTTPEGKYARRDLQMRAIELQSAYSETFSGPPGRSGPAERLWPALFATEQLAYRTVTACWSVAQGGDAPEVVALSVALEDLAQALRTGRVPDELEVPSFGAVEVRAIRAVLIVDGG